MPTTTRTPWIPPVGVTPLDRRNIRTNFEADIPAVLAWLQTKYTGATVDGLNITGRDTGNTYYVQQPLGGSTYTLTKLIKQPEFDALKARVTAVESATPGGFPAEFDHTETITGLAPAAHVDIQVSIPTNRLYGLFVEVTGLSGAQTAFVQMFGDSALTETQYSANFAVSTSQDTAQAWRYRSRAADHILHLRVTNTGPTPVTAQVTFKVEPF